MTLWGGLLLLASQPFRLWFSTTESWLGVARWLIGKLASVGEAPLAVVELEPQ